MTQIYILCLAAAIVCIGFRLIKDLRSKRTSTKGVIWTTKDGRNMYLGDMTDDHLKNAIRYVDTRIVGLVLSKSHLEAEKKRRGLK